MKDKETFLKEYLEPFINRIVIVPSINVRWKQDRKDYLFKDFSQLTNNSLREILPNELVMEFDFSRKGIENIKEAQDLAKKYTNKITKYLKEHNISFHQTDHKGKSSHIRFQIYGLDTHNNYVRREYKRKLALHILERIEYKANDLIHLDESLYGIKLVSLELQKHFKDQYKDIEDILIINEGKLWFPNQDYINKLIETKKTEEVLSPIAMSEINMTKLKKLWKIMFRTGNRQHCVLALAGICKKSGISIQDCVALYTTITKEDDEDRISAIEYTYDHDDPAITHWLNMVFTEEDKILGKITDFYRCFKKNIIDEGFNFAEIMHGDFPPISWTIPGILLENGGFTYIAGEAGKFKTYFTMFMIRSLLTGTPFLNYTNVKKARVMYIDEESGLSRMKHRFNKIMRKHEKDINPDDFNAFSFSNKFVFTDEGMKNLEDAIEQFRPDVVFMDSLTRLFMGKENSSDETKKIYNYLKAIFCKYKCTFVMIHHFNKMAEAGKRLRGSTELTAAADVILNIEEVGNNIYKYYFDKSRDGEKMLPQKFEAVDIDENTLELKYLGKTEEPTKKFAIDKHMKRFEDVVFENNLYGKTITSTEFFKLMGYKGNSNYKYIDQFEKSGLLKKVERGKFLIRGEIKNDNN